MITKLKKVFVVVLGNILVMVMIFFGQKLLEEKVYCNAQLQRGIGVEEITAGALELFTIWGEKRGASFMNPMLDISCTGECVYIVGELDKLQEWDLVDGTLFLDEEGVIITNTIAQQLYHSVYVVGEKLQYEENCYYVRGVVSGERNKVYMLAAFSNADSDGYEWATCMDDEEMTLTQISYAVDRKKCLFQKLPEMLQFQLEKNGYPEIDMLSYPKN